jgi:hypothetical protein
VKGFREIDKADDLVARVGGPRAAIEERIARHDRDRQPVHERESGDDGPPEHAAHLEKGALVDNRVDDRAHLVDLAAVARDRFEQEFLAPVRVVVARQPRRQLEHR